MARVVWTAEAERWLRDIYDYIAADNPRAAAATVEGIYEKAQRSADFPEMGARHWGSSRNVRVLLYGHYRIAYLVKWRRVCFRFADGDAYDVEICDYH